MRLSVLIVLVMVTAAIAPSSQAQGGSGIKSCGEMELFIANPDLRDTADDGKYHVAGDFYMQFQMQGPGAEEVETFTFSVGLPHENPQEICDAPAWAPGLELESYKADFDKEDGFFILMTTTGQSTPQHTDLEVSVRAFNGNGVELARFWTLAVIESCEGPVTENGCPREEVIENDNVKPWPVILPGDGPKSYVDGFTVDFAEPLAENGLLVTLNGDDITAELDAWPEDQRQHWDKDVVYDYGPGGGAAGQGPDCSAQGQACGPGNGPAFMWTQRELTPDDVIRVEAIDEAGNAVVKEIHLAQTRGGALGGSVPILEMKFDHATLTGKPEETVVFTMTMENSGNAEGHPFQDWEEGRDYPEGWPEPVWVPGHEPVPPKGSSSQELHVTIPENTTAGEYKVNPRMNYNQLGRQASVQSALTVQVDAPADISGETEEVDQQESPAPNVAILLLAVGAIALSRRRS